MRADGGLTIAAGSPRPPCNVGHARHVQIQLTRLAPAMRSIGLALLVLLSGCAAQAPEPSTPAVPASATSTASAPASPSASASRSLGPISRDEAVDLARRAVRETGANWQVVLARAGPLGEVRPRWEDLESWQDLSADLPVWRVVLAAGDLSAEVLIDSRNGSVYSTVVGIAN